VLTDPIGRCLPGWEQRPYMPRVARADDMHVAGVPGAKVLAYLGFRLALSLPCKTTAPAVQ